MKTVRMRGTSVLFSGILLILAIVGSSSGQSLPAPWQSAAVGGVGVGTISYSDLTFTIESGGWDIWSTGDGFCYVYQSLSGDGTIIARVTSVENTHWAAKGGVMIRETLDAGSKNAAVTVTPSATLSFQWRAATNDQTYSAAVVIGPPRFVKLVRSGNNFTAYESTDGSTWSQLGTTRSISMASEVYVGMCVSAHDWDGALCTGTFDNVSIAAGGGDTTAPGAISDLATSSPTATSITLSWTAPGDDGSTGTAASYDIRYSTSQIDDGNWGSATQVTGEPAPQAAGTNQSMTVSGLTSETTYYFAIKVTDEVPSTSAISNSPSGTTTAGGADTTAPAAVIDLATSNPTSSSITLSWTAPGDDGSTGTAAGYDIRYSTSEIDDGTWATATQVTGEPAPQGAGSSESMVVSGLEAGTTYYFALKTADEVPNTSTLSNCPSGTTTSGSTLPSPWQLAGIGGATGTASYASPTFTLESSGWDIWGTADAFGYVYRPLSGDGTIIARVASVKNTHWWAKAGVMIRETLDTGSKNAAVVVAPTSGMAFQWRATTNDASLNAELLVGAPRFVKLRRSGDNFTAYESSDGSSWNQLGTTQSIPMAAEVYVGLCVSSHSYEGALCTGTFDNVSVTAGAGDTMAPAAVSDLATSSPTSNSITLSWTAPGNDDSTGTAASYDIRYSTSEIDDGNWGSAAQVTGEPTPAVAGTNQNMVVGGLSADTTYYFAIKTSDEVFNTSAISNSPSGTTTAGGGDDTTAPAAVTNLVTRNPTSSSITLTWTAPGDDGSMGTAAGYDIRYSTSSITEGNWASATPVTGEPAPAAAGSSQSMFVTGLSASTTYYFAIKTADEVPNTSAISNSPSGTTVPAGPSTIIALKRHAGLLVAGAIDARFNNANVVTDTVQDSLLWHQQMSRYYNGGTGLYSDGVSYTCYKFDLAAVPELDCATINRAQLRFYHTHGNGASSMGGVKRILTYDWTEGTVNGTYPGAAGGVSWAHPIGYHTYVEQNASGGTEDPHQSWGYNRDSMFGWDVDAGSLLDPFSAPTGEGYHVIDVTSHVQAWVRGSYPNYGWIQNGGSWDFHTSETGSATEPVLFIDYSRTGDTTPPAAVTGLAAGSATSNSLTVTWTAPGDDGSTGTASSYDLRYSTFLINAGNWGAAVQVSGEPVPAAPGTSQSMVVTGLKANTTYYFAIKTADEMTNTSALSNLPNGHTLPDVTAPAAVTNLATGSATSSSITLSWTAPGDDDSTGTATSYDIRYSTSEINAGNWDAATQVSGEPTPTAAGTSQSMAVTGLVHSTTYYFAMKASDEIPNTSGLSNVATGQTPPDVTAPAAVTNLALSKPKSSTMTLTWTAPGDDGSSGTASSYDVRYSTSPINEGNWASATQVTGEPAPAVAGTSQKIVIRDLTPQRTYYFAVKASDEVPNTSGLSNVPSGQTTDTSPINRPVLCQDDFEYLGAFLMPYITCGTSTAFSGTGLAIRRVDGQLRVISGAHRSAGDPIYEVAFPGWGTEWGTWPQATLTNQWGNAVYGNPNMKHLERQGMWTEGLLYDEATNRLYFSWGPDYNTAGIIYPSLGYAVLDAGGPIPYGPWRPVDTGGGNKYRGGTLKIPDWFTSYVGGRTMGIGFGGPYSGNHSCSQGPFLAAIHAPDESTTELDVVKLIDYPFSPDNARLLDRWATRDPDYYGPWSPQQPVNGVGYWTYMDLIWGGCTWIDLPDKHGLLYAATMAHGEIWYRYGTAGCDSRDNEWWMYDPSDLVSVAQGLKQPWETPRDDWHVVYNPPQYAGAVDAYGCAFDAQTRTLFIMTSGTYRVGKEWYPLVHGYRVKESLPPHLIGDINGDGYVNVGDLQALVAAWGSQAGPPASANWNANADINEDAFVNVGDLQLLVAHWGEHL